MKEKWMNTEEAAEYLGYAKSTLDQKRYDGTGPDYYKIGKPKTRGAPVRYKQSDLDKWMNTERQKVGAGDDTDNQ